MMKGFQVLTLLIAGGFAAPYAPLYSGVGAIYKGPDSETIVKGPDGSRITSKAEGAALATEEKLEPIVGPGPYPYGVPGVPKKEEGPAEKAPEEIVALAEKSVAAFPKSDAVIIALQEPKAYPKGYLEEEGPRGYEEEEEEEEDDDEDEDEHYEPFLIKEY